MTYRYPDGYPPPGARVSPDKAPNHRYHGHVGKVVRYLWDAAGDCFAEIIWDDPPPVEGMNRQNILLEYLVPPLFQIQEEP